MNPHPDDLHLEARSPEDRLRGLNLSLPIIVAPAGNLLGFRIRQGVVYVSGQLPLADGQPRFVGKVGRDLSRDEAYQAARLAVLNAIAQLSLAAGGDLSRVAGILKLSGFVNADPEFTDLAFVINGASDLLVEVFGDRGRHARFAVGVGTLPRGVAVEVDLVAELDPSAVSE